MGVVGINREMKKKPFEQSCRQKSEILDFKIYIVYLMYFGQYV